ncbi:MAG: 3-dehydroquinate synthase [Ignavibacteriales bacterium]|nr:MAG: 3-dehydroquinate synthase [Ignavibacteriales bacterium]
MKKIEVELKEKPYPIFIGKNIISQILPKQISQKYSKILIISDKNVAGLYGNELNIILKKTRKPVYSINVASGENSKSYLQVERIHKFLLKNNFNRDSLIVGFGGGVVGDLAGFVASTYMRGVDFCQIPTTLLAMVDSSVGGKTGINLSGSKNIIGSFYQPVFVIAETSFLKTLEEDEWICGLGEILKYSIIATTGYFNFVKRNIKKILVRDDKIVERIVFESVKIKAAVVKLDEKEAGLRKILNLGHTFGHAIESILNYKIKHGAAVIAGLLLIADLSKRVGMLQEKDFVQISNLLQGFTFNHSLKKLSTDGMLNLMLKDKKSRNDKIKFVLIKKIGYLVIDADVNEILIIETLQNAGDILK